MVLLLIISFFFFLSCVHSTTAATLLGDLDQDNDVDIFDYNLLISHFGQSECAYNLTDTCIIDIFDYNILIGNFGRLPTPGSASPTPTPDTSVLKAFPGAIGFGSDTKGGRGGKVIYVTNLNDSGPGSFREAIASSGPRTILFKVSGTINLANDLNLNNPYITIAGQSAPGQGVQIKGGMLKVETHDVILRYLKIRKGNPTGGNAADTDSISLAGNKTEVYNLIVDHSSLLWGTDIGGLSILTNAHDITIQDTIAGEGLYLSNHPEATESQGGHSMSLNITSLNTSGKPTRVTLFRNLITSSDSRNPQIIEGVNVDVVNNVMYNWGNKSAFGNPISLNLINNYFKWGPLSNTTNMWNLRIDADWTTRHDNAVFRSGNYADGYTGTWGGQSSIYSSTQKTPYSIGAADMPAQASYAYVTANVGANRPVRDSVDQRVIDNLRNGVMRHPNGTIQNRFINAADLVWPNLSGGTPLPDQDNDGMADNWEQTNFGTLSRGSASDSSSDYDRDGYTDLEEFLNLTDPIH